MTQYEHDDLENLLQEPAKKVGLFRKFGGLVGGLSPERSEPLKTPLGFMETVKGKFLYEGKRLTEPEVRSVGDLLPVELGGITIVRKPPLHTGVKSFGERVTVFDSVKMPEEIENGGFSSGIIVHEIQYPYEHGVNAQLETHTVRTYETYADRMHGNFVLSAGTQIIRLGRNNEPSEGVDLLSTRDPSEQEHIETSRILIDMSTPRKLDSN